MGTPLTWDAVDPQGNPYCWDDPRLTWDGNIPEGTSIMSEMNRVSASLAAPAITGILGAIQTINTNLPFLVGLTDSARHALPKMADKSEGFHEKASGYMTTNPEFRPGFVDMVEVGKDQTLRDQMQQFTPQLSTLTQSVQDTLMVVSSELYMADLAYYQSVREAAKRGVPAAKTIYDDLQKRFPGHSKPPTP